MSDCEYCNKPVAPPLPIHPECGRIWLRGFHAREESERKDFVNKVIDGSDQKTKSTEWMVEIDGFKTDKDFARHLCRQIVGMMQDLHKGDGDTLFKRIESLYHGADMYLTMEGDGVSGSEMLGILNR